MINKQNNDLLMNILGHSESDKTIRAKLRLWLLEHPNYNFFKFSFQDFLKKLTSSSRILPSFIIIGSSKSGTTSLAGYLDQHPDIVTISDIHYFEYTISNNPNWYRAHFPMKKPNKQNFIVGEHTATYLFHPLVPKRIYNLIPNCKFIILLRNPIDRAYSNYQHQVREGLEIRTFEDAIESELRRIDMINENKELKINNPDFDNAIIFSYLRHGIFVDKIKAWMDIFPKEQFLILQTNELSEKPKIVLEKTFDFLKMGRYSIPNLKKRNVGNYQKMSDSTRNTLKEFYKPHNERLYKLLGQDFDWDS